MGVADVLQDWSEGLCFVIDHTPAAMAYGRPSPRVDYDRPYVLAYDVSVAGAPARCAVFGRFDDQPSTGIVEASGITLRIDPP